MSNGNLNNSKKLKVEANISFQNKEFKANIDINEQYIEIDPHEKSTELDTILLHYNSIVFFAINDSENFIVINYIYGEHSMDAERTLKIYPNDKSQRNLTTKLVRELYDSINYFNTLHPSEEFENEQAGDNELYTAESFK